MKRQTGMTLIEILIAIVVISLGLLGVATMQVVGLKNSNSAYYRSTATVLAADMMDAMRVNRQAAGEGVYDTAGSFKDASDKVSAPATVWQQDMNGWLDAVSKRLPAGKGKIEAAANASIIRVIVQWNDDRGINASGQGTKEVFVETQGCGANTGCVF